MAEAKLAGTEIQVEPGKPVTARTGRTVVLVLPADPTLKDIGTALVNVERQEGAIVARKLATELHYDRVTDLARRFLKNRAGEPDNNPNVHMPTRFMLLLGMDDAELPRSDWEDDPTTAAVDVIGPVRMMSRALRILGEPAEETAAFDEALLAVYLAWNAKQKQQHPQQQQPPQPQPQPQQHQTPAPAPGH